MGESPNQTSATQQQEVFLHGQRFQCTGPVLRGSQLRSSNPSSRVSSSSSTSPAAGLPTTLALAHWRHSLAEQPIAHTSINSIMRPPIIAANLKRKNPIIQKVEGALLDSRDVATKGASGLRRASADFGPRHFRRVELVNDSSIRWNAHGGQLSLFEVAHLVVVGLSETAEIGERDLLCAQDHPRAPFRSTSFFVVELKASGFQTFVTYKSSLMQ